MNRTMFADKVAIVTGGGSGIGEALCFDLARQGARVFIVGINQEQVDVVERNIIAEGGNAKAICIDVFDFDAYSDFINSVIEEENRIDYLFNNAGITLICEFKDTPIERSIEVLNTNLMGVVNGIHLVYPFMCSQGSGHIVNTSSLAGILGYPTSSIYAASKAAVLALSNSLRYEAEEYGVRVSSVCPGYVDTGIFKQERILGATRDSIIEGIPFKMIQPLEASNYILKGVKKNKRLIIFPFYAKFTAFLGALCPALLKGVYEDVINSFRSNN